MFDIVHDLLSRQCVRPWFLKRPGAMPRLAETMYWLTSCFTYAAVPASRRQW